ncbi:MAG: hypothetical protein ACREL6_02400, partial [Gemmatimonadales bacterium]
MPFQRKQKPAADAAGDPSPFRGRRRMRHLDDQVLDQLLEPEPDEDLIATVADHAGGCVECRQRLEEWTTLFPQLRTVLPPVEETGAQIPRADLPRVVIPDNEPPRPPAASHRLAWSIAMVLLVAVVVLAWQLLRSGEDELPSRTVATTPTDPEPETASPSVADSTVARETSESETTAPQETPLEREVVPPVATQSVDTSQTRPTRMAAGMFTSPAVVVTRGTDVPADSGEEELSGPDRATGLAAGMPRATPDEDIPAEPGESEPEPAEVTRDPEPAENRGTVEFSRREPEVTAARQPANVSRSGRRPGQ